MSIAFSQFWFEHNHNCTWLYKMCIKVLVINIILIITLYINAYQSEYVLLYEYFSSAAATVQQEPARYISYRASCKGKASSNIGRSEPDKYLQIEAVT